MARANSLTIRQILLNILLFSHGVDFYDMQRLEKLKKENILGHLSSSTFRKCDAKEAR